MDRAKERRLAELRGEMEKSGEVKGLDFELLRKVRSGEFVMPKFEVPEARPGEGGSDSEEEGGGEGDEMDEDAILDELLQMEMEELEEAEKAKLKKKEEEEEEDKEEMPVEPVAEEEVTEKPTEDVAKSRFKPVVDAKQLKQMRREQKRRKLAMEAMDRISKPAPPPPPPKKTRAELLEQLRKIQAEKKQQTSMPPPPPPKPIPETVVPTQDVPLVPTISAHRLSTDHKMEPEFTTNASISSEPQPPPRNPEPTPAFQSPPPVKISENMFSDESELSEYNPYDSDSDSDNEKPTKETHPAVPLTKRNYFGDTEKPMEEPSKPLTMDPTIAAALRKAAALTDKRGVPEEVVKEEKKMALNRMSLGGSGGVYEFDEDDTWDGEEEEEVGKKKRKRK